MCWRAVSMYGLESEQSNFKSSWVIIWCSDDSNHGGIGYWSCLLLGANGSVKRWHLKKSTGNGRTCSEMKGECTTATEDAPESHKLGSFSKKKHRCVIAFSFVYLIKIIEMATRWMTIEATNGYLPGTQAYYRAIHGFIWGSRWSLSIPIRIILCSQ